MSGLNARDMQVLRGYAANGNRELYWNYLAQHEGADGYGLLALGVVRNDSMPGAVANNFAQNHARSHDGRVLSEREWEGFGRDLINRDLERRERQMTAGRPDLALNLPVRDVQYAHDGAFHHARIDPNAWTPRQLLEAARRQGGDAAAEGVWHSMLDNSALGIGRAGITMWDIARHDDAQLPALRYSGALIGASAMASQDRANVNPDVIGGAQFYYMRDRDGAWSSVANGGGMAGPAIQRVTDARTIAELDDARAVRLERREMATRFHPLDPHRTIARSPFTVADAGDVPTTPGARTLAASFRDYGPVPGGPMQRAGATHDPSDPSHPDHRLYTQIQEGVRRLDDAQGRRHDDISERMAASLLPLAKQHGLERVDHVVLSRDGGTVRAGENVFVVQGRLDDPAMLRAAMPTETATRTPVEESLARAQALDANRRPQPEQAVAQAQTQDPRSQQPDPVMRSV